MKKSLLILAMACGFLLVPELRASAVDVYIAQTAAGAGDGSSCANAAPVAYFNAGGNWGAGAAQIGAGTVVHLCGGITTDLTFQSDGAAGNSVVLDGTGASFIGMITVSNRQYWAIRNVTWFVGSPGGIAIAGGAFGLITGNHMDMGPGAIFLGQNSGLPHDIVISNNFFRNSASDVGGDLVTTEGSYDIVVEGNYFENRATNENSHVDCVQTWEKGGGSAGPPRDWTIRYNYFVMNTPSQYNKSFHMLEGLTGSVKIYGNVYFGLRGGSAANGINMNSNQTGMRAEIYGNTLVQKAGGTNNLFNLKGRGEWILRNNVTYSTDAGNTLTGDAVGGRKMTRSNNLWFGPGSPSCVETEICSSNPLFTDINGGDFSLQNGSPAIGSGMNLGEAYATSPLQGAQWPNPMLGSRPASGAWDMGAFVATGGSSSAPIITTQPANQTVVEGQTATFLVMASGLQPIGYRWRRGGVDMPGATASSYTTLATVLADSGATFDVVVSNAVGEVTSSTATLTVNPLAVAAVALNPASVTGGSSSTGTVTLNGPAAAGGVVVALSSSNTAAATVPDSVMVAATMSAATFTVNTQAVTSATSATITAVYNGSAGGNLSVNPPPNFVRVNSGGSAYTDSQGQIWSADTGFIGGAAATMSGNKPIASTVDDPLYRSERAGTFTYAFTMPAGSYQVTLKFAETEFTKNAPGPQRLFDVAINGVVVLVNFDIKAAAGGANAAVDRTFMVNAGAGSNNLQLQFLHAAGQPGNPKVNAIQILKAP